MINREDNITVFDENEIFEIAALSVIGDREEQQDCFGYELRNKEGMVVLCDGMGGHNGGKLASNLTTEYVIKSYCEETSCTDFHKLLVELAMESDSMVSGLSWDDGTPMQAGSTMVSVIMSDDYLFWLSVGDSRIYIMRKDELVCVTKDHIYRNVLEEQYRTDQITEEEYNGKAVQGEMLVSFLGINGLPYIESNDSPFCLNSGDRILLMSDGLYKIISDDEIYTILFNFNNINEAVQALELKARRKAQNMARDNTTLILIKKK